MLSSRIKEILRRRNMQMLVLFTAGIAAVMATYITVTFLASVYLNMTPVAFTPASVADLILPTTAFMVAALLMYAVGIILVGWFYRAIGLPITLRAIRYAALTVTFGGTLCLLLITSPNYQGTLSADDRFILAVIMASSFGFLYVFGWRLGQAIAPADHLIHNHAAHHGHSHAHSHPHAHATAQVSEGLVVESAPKKKSTAVSGAKKASAKRVAVSTTHKLAIKQVAKAPKAASRKPAVRKAVS